MRKFTLLFAGLFLLYGHILAQSHQIKGKVMDENGVPVPNASVIIVGTTKGTVTDAEGNFSLQVSKSVRALSFSAASLATSMLSMSFGLMLDRTFAEAVVPLASPVKEGTPSITISG